MSSIATSDTLSRPLGMCMCYASTNFIKLLLSGLNVIPWRAFSSISGAIPSWFFRIAMGAFLMGLTCALVSLSVKTSGERFTMGNFSRALLSRCRPSGAWSSFMKLLKVTVISLPIISVMTWASLSAVGSGLGLFAPPPRTIEPVIRVTAGAGGVSGGVFFVDFPSCGPSLVFIVVSVNGGFLVCLVGRGFSSVVSAIFTPVYSVLSTELFSGGTLFLFGPGG